METLPKEMLVVVNASLSSASYERTSTNIHESSLLAISYRFNYRDHNIYTPPSLTLIPLLGKTLRKVMEPPSTNSILIAVESLSLDHYPTSWMKMGLQNLLIPLNFEIMG